jgi:hypothetical protein
MGDHPMSERSDAKRTLLRHFLAALAYHTQKALRGAPPLIASLLWPVYCRVWPPEAIRGSEMATFPPSGT